MPELRDIAIMAALTGAAIWFLDWVQDNFADAHGRPPITYRGRELSLPKGLSRAGRRAMASVIADDLASQEYGDLPHVPAEAKAAGDNSAGEGGIKAASSFTRHSNSSVRTSEERPK